MWQHRVQLLSQHTVTMHNLGTFADARRLRGTQTELLTANNPAHLAALTPQGLFAVVCINAMHSGWSSLVERAVHPLGCCPCRQIAL